MACRALVSLLVLLFDYGWAFRLDSATVFDASLSKDLAWLTCDEKYKDPNYAELKGEVITVACGNLDLRLGDCIGGGAFGITYQLLKPVNGKQAIAKLFPRTAGTQKVVKKGLSHIVDRLLKDRWMQKVEQRLQARSGKGINRTVFDAGRAAFVRVLCDDMLLMDSMVYDTEIIETAPGKNLEQIINSGTAPAGMWKSAGASLLSAIYFLAARGWRHGDLSASNIMYDTPSDSLHLVDYDGLSKCPQRRMLVSWSPRMLAENGPLCVFSQGKDAFRAIWRLESMMQLEVLKEGKRPWTWDLQQECQRRHAPLNLQEWCVATWQPSDLLHGVSGQSWPDWWTGLCGALATIIVSTFSGDPHGDGRLNRLDAMSAVGDAAELLAAL